MPQHVRRVRTVSIVAGGYLGQRLARHLVENKYKVKLSYRTKAPEVEVFGTEHFSCVLTEGTLEYDKGLFDADCLVICIPPGFKQGVADFYPLHIKLLLQEGQNAGCRQVIFTSSIGIYPQSGDFREKSQFTMQGEKQKCLLQAELAVLASCVKYKQVLRLAGLIGPGRHPGRFRVSLGSESAQTCVNMVLVQDVVEAIHQLIDQPDTPSSVYNLVSPHHPSKQAFYRFARQSLGLDVGALSTVAIEDAFVIPKRVSGALIAQETDFRYQYSKLFEALLSGCISTEAVNKR